MTEEQVPESHQAPFLRGLQSNLHCSLLATAHTNWGKRSPKWDTSTMKKEPFVRSSMQALWKAVSFLPAYPIYKAVFSPPGPCSLKHRWKQKQTEERKKKKKSTLNDFQPHKLPPSSPTKSDKEIKLVSPFLLKASASSQSLLKWKEKSHPPPRLNGCWKPPESLWSKLTGLDGNTRPYCFGTSCQLMTQ